MNPQKNGSSKYHNQSNIGSGGIGRQTTTTASTKSDRKSENNNKKNSRKNMSGNNKKKKNSEKGVGGDKKSTSTGNGVNNKNIQLPVRDISNLPDPPVKLERAKTTFVIGHKLNKVFNKLTGSRESLNKIDEHEDENRFTLKRSLTLSSFSLKRHNRKSLQKPVLEELKEDAVLEKVEPKSNETPPSPPPFDPPPLKRSASFIDRLKRRLSSVSTKPSKESGMRSSWNTSLQNLQKIDNMVKYDDLSFVNYDKFNTYVQRVERQLSQTDLTRNYSTLDLREDTPIRRYPSTLSLRSIDPTATVRLRPKKRISFNLGSENNLLRQSLDSDRFQMMKNTEQNHAAPAPVVRDRSQSFTAKRKTSEPFPPPVSPKFRNEQEYYAFLKKSFEAEEEGLDMLDSAHVETVHETSENLKEKNEIKNIKINNTNFVKNESETITGCGQINEQQQWSQAPVNKNNSRSMANLTTVTELELQETQVSDFF